MAIKQPFAIKTVLGNTDLELTADPGESFLIKDILTHYCASTYCTIRTDKTTVGYFRQGGPMGAHIFRLANWNKHSHRLKMASVATPTPVGYYPIKNALGAASKFHLVGDTDLISGAEDVHEAMQMVTGGRVEPLLKFLELRGIWKGYPVAEGESFKITGVAQANAKQVLVYEIHEAGDMSPELENGSKSLTYMFLNYGNCGAAINASGDSLYTTSQSPAEFPSFPFGSVVPAKHEIEILGICASPVAVKENDDTDYIYTQFLKLIKDREVLFDEDRQGIIFDNRQLSLAGRSDSFAQGFSLIGNKSEFDLNDPFMFDPPLKFVPGDELGIYVTTVQGGSGQDISTEEHEICLIERVTRLE